MADLLLIHGGLWQDMDADRFWVRPGVVAGLRADGHAVMAPDRPRRPQSWAAEVAHLLPLLPDRPFTVVAGSNGCSVAARLALAHPDRVERLVLAWPATAGDAEADSRAREHLAAAGAPGGVVEVLLGGGILRGVLDEQLSRLRLPVGVLPSEPPNATHQRRTVDALLLRLPPAVELSGCPESLHPAFPEHLARMVAEVGAFAEGAPLPASASGCREGEGSGGVRKIPSAHVPEV